MTKTRWDKILGTKKLVFTVTTGRSGTHYLTRILNYVPGLEVHHEERTHCFEHHLRSAQETKEYARDFLEKEKLPFIAHTKSDVYVECSHLFCKGFFEPLIDLGVVPDLVLLRRDNRAIAKSLFQLNTIPGKTESGLKFYLAPFDPNVQKVENWEQLTDYQLCYWYCLEIERRRIVYADTVKSLGGRVSDVDLSDLLTVQGFKRMLRELDLPNPNLIGWLKFYKNKRRKAGDFSSVKEKRELPENVREQEKEIELFF